MLKIANVAIDGSNIAETTVSGYVSYDIYRWQNGDEFSSGYWYYSSSSTTGAKITGTVHSTQKMKVNGKSVAVSGDITNETWVASPAIPGNTSTRRYEATSPTSGSGQGTIQGDNSKNVKVNGKLVAIVGSQVETCLGSTTTIQDGSSLINL
ncbi:hypothetical protein [Paenibacillus sp. FSL E2-0178]|uniref:hypothetical protein n=1 Tax=Paenibacillus sp. FSL E2-0178 TaxID=2921361 RepID=UPI003158B61D